MKLACSTNISKYYDWRSYWYDLSVCSNGLFTLNEISGCDTTSDARQEPVASGHSGDNTDRGDRGAETWSRGSQAVTWGTNIFTQTRHQTSCSIRSIGFHTEKAPTRAFSWLKAPISAFTFKTLLRHYAKQALTPPTCPSLMTFASASQFHIYFLLGQRSFRIVS